MPRLRHLTLPLCGFAVAACLTTTALAGGKKPKAPPTPWGLWKPLVQPGAKWMLYARNASNEPTVTVETYDVRKVGEASVARLRWSLAEKGKKAEELAAGGPIEQVAVTDKGAYVLAKDESDTKIIEALKKPPTYGDPPAAIDSTKHNDGKNIEHRTTKLGRMVCIGYGPAKGAGECENICHGAYCLSPEKGIVALEGTYGPGDEEYAQRGLD